MAAWAALLGAPGLAGLTQINGLPWTADRREAVAASLDLVMQRRRSRRLDLRPCSRPPVLLGFVMGVFISPKYLLNCVCLLPRGLDRELRLGVAEWGRALAAVGGREGIEEVPAPDRRLCNSENLILRPCA